MIHIASVHMDTDVWFKRQLHYIEKYVGEEYKLYMVLPALVKRDPDIKKVHYPVTNIAPLHAPALNLLTDEMMRNAAPDDLLMWLDGDAFPVGDVLPTVREHLAKSPLVAVTRVENLGELYPHPVFCATTAKFWSELPGTWERGFIDRVDTTRVKEPGGVLWQRLTAADVNWQRLFKTNRRTLHPLWFAVYGNMIYHHGAASRMELGFFDLDMLAQQKSYFDAMADCPREQQEARYTELMEELLVRVRRLGWGVEDWMDADPNFHKWLTDDDAPEPPPLPRYCEHKHLRFMGLSWAHQLSVECLDCYARGPQRRLHDMAIKSFHEYDRRGQLKQPTTLLWRARYTFALDNEKRIVATRAE